MIILMKIERLKERKVYMYILKNKGINSFITD